MSLWACLLAPASQVSIREVSTQFIKQLADSSLLSPSSQLPPLWLPYSFLHLLKMCLSLSVSDNKQADAQVCSAGTALPASPSPNSTDLTQTSQMRDGGELCHK